MRVKGLKKLNSVITKQLAPFGIHKAFCSDDFSYWYESEDVHYKLTVTVEDEWFMDFIEETFGYKAQYPFIMSLLHEIGHHYTIDEVEDEDETYSEDEKERISEEMQTANAEQTKVLEWEYFNLPDEIIATEWAVAYAIEHTAELAEMWTEILNALQDFYEINKIEG